MASVPPSRPDQIRQVFRDNPNTIFTRRQIIEKCFDGDVFDLDRKYFSMTISRMWFNGELKKYNVAGHAGFCLKNDNPFVQ